MGHQDAADLLAGLGQRQGGERGNGIGQRRHAAQHVGAVIAVTDRLVETAQPVGMVDDDLPADGYQPDDQ